MHLSLMGKKEISPCVWSNLPWGKHYLNTLNHYFFPYWSKIFGFHLVKIGGFSAEILSDACTITHQFTLNVDTVADIMADFSHLPLLDKSVDACLLSQTLNYCQDPHQLLREVDRVLVDDGWLLLSCFSPLSCMGLINKYWQCRKLPFKSQLFSQWRIKDWLSLLNYEIIDSASLQIYPWHSQLQQEGNYLAPLLGCLTVIVARKRTIPLTRIRLTMKKRVSVIPKPIGVTKNLSDKLFK